MRGRLEWGLVAGLLLPASAGLGQQDDPYRWARVIEVTSGTVSIDAGTSEGVRQWTRVEIVRGGRPVAILRVISLGAHQMKGEITSRPLALIAGDSARFVPAGRPNSAVAAPAAPSPPVLRPPAVDAPAAPRPQPPAPVSPTRPAAPQPPRVSPPGRVAPRSDSAVAAPSMAGLPPVPPPVASRLPAPAGPSTRTARVTFLTSSSVYISAGKAEGLAEGIRVNVVRAGRSVAELRVAFVSTHQSSCQIVSKTDSLVLGDSVRFQPVDAARDSSPAATARAPAPRPVSPRPSRRSNVGRIRGRIGLYYLSVEQRDSLGGRFSQPSGDIRLTGVGLGGSPIGLVLDLRSRHQVQVLPGGTNHHDQTRVYQAAVSWQAPGSPYRFTTGRQYAPGISSVGLVDGASAEVGLPAWDYGLFAGTQPELINLGFSSDVALLGGYLRRHNRPESLRRWSVTLGASGSYLNGYTNREFMYLQGNYVTRRLSIYAVQEVDYYRPWRRIDGERAVSPTSTFANIQFLVATGFSLTTGVDNRRSARLYRDVVNPATVFDDTFRRGVWGGFSVRAARHFQASVDARTNGGASSGTANTFTLALGADRLTPLGMSLRSRSTRYTTGGRQGWLNSVSFGIEPFGRGSVQLTSGWRTEHDRTAAPTLNIRWVSADLDVSLARSLFIIVSGYREDGGIEAHDLLYAGLTFRF